MADDPLTFSELDKLSELNPLDLNKDEAKLAKLIQGIRAYRANALSKGGKATKTSEASGLKAEDIMKLIKKSSAPAEKIRRI